MARAFTDFMRELRYGRSVEEATDAVTKIVAAVKATGKAGKLTITLEFKPPQKGSINYIEVSDTVAAKIPEPDKPTSIFFPTSTNDLTRYDPQQRTLALGSVDKETGEIIDTTIGEALG